ncbi:DUF2004 domain-containing protein [Flavobacterium sp. JP2137]|uniref:DUF2004 domain-containing protein n=1 Tax=Flavobacterium sp. JP2137 TaxID=3414510 RepID=UPI003D2FC348
MGEFKLLNVGVIKGSHLEEYYRVMMESNGKKYQLELNFQNKTIEECKRGILKDFMLNLGHFEKANCSALQENFKQGGPVKSYLDFHYDLLGRENLLKQFNINPELPDVKVQLFTQMQLIRIALYPDGKYNMAYYATFDYVLDGDLCDEILSIKTDQFGAIQYIDWER